MATIKINVTGEICTIAQKVTFTAGSYGVYDAEVTTDASWDDLALQLCVISAPPGYPRMPDSGRCIKRSIPIKDGIAELDETIQPCMVSDNAILIGLLGCDADGKITRYSTVSAAGKVCGSGCIDDTILGDESRWAELISYVNATIKSLIGTPTDEQVRNAIDSYASEHGISTGATAEQAAQIKQNTQDIVVLGATEPVNINDIGLWEQGHIKTADGTDGASDASSYPVKIRTAGYISDTIASATITSGASFKVFRYSSGGVYVDNISGLTKYSDFNFDTYKYRIELTRDAATDIDVSFYDHIKLWSRYNAQLADALTRVKTVNGKSPDSDGNVAVETNTSIPTIMFDFDHDMRDVSGELASMDYSNKSSQNDVMEQVYALFDGLVSDYSDYVSRADAAEIAGLPYPDYANGVSGSSTYFDTPAYKTYLYKFVCSNSSAGNDESGKLPKKKMLVISGIHGNEIAAPFNCYLFAKQLCSGVLNDPNFFKLRAAFDIYIMPCVNGYGMYHVQRGNADGVNLNRNFPVDGWAVSGEDTKSSPYECNYTGESAGSEFETQLVMAVTDYLEPDIVIDHHNYARLQRQFYTSLCDAEWLPLAYQSLVDCSIAFKKHLPSYFGMGYDLIVHDSGSAPGSVSGTGTGTVNRWCYEHGVPFESTVEISECINYIDGEYSGEKNDNFGADTFSVAEYTLRNIILHAGQWVLDHR